MAWIDSYGNLPRSAHRQVAFNKLKKKLRREPANDCAAAYYVPPGQYGTTQTMLYALINKLDAMGRGVQPQPTLAAGEVLGDNGAEASAAATGAAQQAAARADAEKSPTWLSFKQEHESILGAKFEEIMEIEEVKAQAGAEEIEWKNFMNKAEELMRGRGGKKLAKAVKCGGQVEDLKRGVAPPSGRGCQR